MPLRLKAWMDAHPRTRLALVTVYYFMIIAGLIALYGRGDFSTPAFVYQEF
jgi:D-Ala-teichoic acid biosynthesis protein